MLQGMATSNIQVDDVPAASAWYADLFGVAPYFEREGYAEFRLGRDGDEFGIVDERFVPGAVGRAPGGQFVYWSVDDVDEAVAAFVARGARPAEPRTVRGPGYVTASVIDPWGNVIGVMENPHWRGEE